MAPKKKSKKGGDDWDEGLGESADPIAEATADANAEDGAPDDDEGAGGLMAALRKNKEKRKKKGKITDNDFVEGEDPVESNLAEKAPIEASMEDEDVLAQPAKKGKAGKTKPEPEEDAPTDGKIKTKAEKEKEKKEREKQRKKEQAAAKKKTPAPVAQPKEEKVEVVEEPKAEAPGKKKKLSPALALLQKQQEELRRRQQEDAQSVAEEQARIEAEEKAAAEEEKRRVEAKAAKKEREKKKIEEMKKAGTYKTDKQRRDEAQAKLRLQQMLESGTAKVEGADGETRKKDDRKKRNPKKEAEERKAREQEELEIRLKEEQAQRLAEEAEKARLNAEEKKDDSELDDWEAMAEKDDVKESWDAESESEKDEKPAEESEEESDSDDSESSDSETEHVTPAQRQANLRKEAAHAKRQAELVAARAAASKDNLRSPIACILGHVDTGKTKILDKIRKTSVQASEAGGITQQIGASYYPVKALQTKTQVVNQDGAFEFKTPGLLIIDTPGHESFGNLRTRGSSLCNIAILVVDIVHGLEPQTLESMRLLRAGKVPFIVALNKVDRLYSWKAVPDNGIRDSLKHQNQAVQNEFADRVAKTKLAFAEQGFNAELFWENKSMAKNVSLVPTSAITGEGIPDLLLLLMMLTQERMTGQLMFLSEVSATILEVKTIDGLGTTLDVILSNGVLREGDTCVICGSNGPITFTIRSILTPGDMKELRVKSTYIHHKEVKAALGVKLTGNGLDDAIAGSRLLVAKNPDDEDELEDLEEDVMGDLEQLMSRISKTGRGVFVQASTLGSLEALLEFLKASKIPVGNLGIGTVFKRDVIQASTMLEKAPEYAIMLCFDVKIDKDAAELAEASGVTIFSAPIIYHLFDRFTEHMKKIAERKKEESKLLAVFPCVLKPVAVFNKTGPIVIGVDCLDGTLRLGTPLAAVKMNPETKSKEVVSLGRVSSIERDHKAVPVFKKGQPSVAIKIEGGNQPSYGRQLEESDTLYSQISRASIDVLKEHFRDEVDKEGWALIAKHLKGLFDIA